MAERATDQEYVNITLPKGVAEFGMAITEVITEEFTQSETDRLFLSWNGVDRVQGRVPKRHATAVRDRIANLQTEDFEMFVD